MARGLKFHIENVEGFYYLCSENIGGGQLCGYREADLRLCFRICKRRFSHDAAHLDFHAERLYRKPGVYRYRIFFLHLLFKHR